MKFKKYIYVILFGMSCILLLILFVWWQNQVQNGNKNKSGSKKEAQKRQLYFCPMHPHIVSNKKGSCPICSMDLVLEKPLKVKPEMGKGSTYIHGHTNTGDYANTEKEQSTRTGTNTHRNTEKEAKLKAETFPSRSSFYLPLDRQQMIGVRLEKVQRRKLFKSVKAPGRIAFDPELYTVQGEYIEALKQWQRVRKSPLKEVRQSTKEMIRSAKIRLKILGLSDEQIKRLSRKKYQSEGLLLSDSRLEKWIYAEVF